MEGLNDWQYWEMWRAGKNRPEDERQELN